MRFADSGRRHTGGKPYRKPDAIQAGSVFLIGYEEVREMTNSAKLGVALVLATVLGAGAVWSAANMSPESKGKQVGGRDIMTAHNVTAKDKGKKRCKTGYRYDKKRKACVRRRRGSF